MKKVLYSNQKNYMVFIKAKKEKKIKKIFIPKKKRLLIILKYLEKWIRIIQTTLIQLVR